MTNCILFILCFTFVAQDKPATPAELYSALLKEYERASGGGAKNDEERLKMIGRVYRHRNELGEKFVALAEKYPADPLAVDALMHAVWQVNGTPWPAELVGDDAARRKAITILIRDHVKSEKLGQLCLRVQYGFAREYETFLRKVLDGSPHPYVQALTCLGLAHFLHNRQHRLDLLAEEATLAKEFEDLFGKEYLAELRKQDRAAVTKDVESLLERAAAKYAAVKVPGGGTVGEKAKAGLFEVRHLSVGQEAPDIDGVDEDGKRFRLSDYRGKVVLLDFWHQQ